MLLRGITFGLTVLASACVVMPLPHRANVTPPVSGRISYLDSPAAGVSVRVCEASVDVCCVGRAREDTTGVDGGFRVEPARETKLLAYVMAHKIFYWCLAVEHQSHVLEAGPYRQYTLVDSGPAVPQLIECVVSDNSLNCQVEDDAGYGT